MRTIRRHHGVSFAIFVGSLLLLVLLALVFYPQRLTRCLKTALLQERPGSDAKYLQPSASRKEQAMAVSPSPQRHPQAVCALA